MIDFRRMLCRQILIQLTSKSSINELQPSAYSKYRLVGDKRFSQHNHFHIIPFFTAVEEIFQRFFMIDLGIHIMAAGEQKTITHPDELL